MARNFNSDIGLLLDDASYDNQSAIQNKLKMLLTIGSLKNSLTGLTGQVICAGIYDKSGNKIAKEREAMKRHVNHGLDIIGGSDWLRDAKAVVGYHHEQYDGSGYPNGLSGDSIPLNARIFAIADVFDALTSSRPYKDSIAFKKAMEIMEKGRGGHFDPPILDIFTRIATSLYENYSNGSEQALQDKLEEITRHYFAEELYR